MDELMSKGLKVVPVTIWGDEVVIGFNPKELSRLFGLTGDDNFEADLPEMISKFEIILKAACTATLQIPEDRLGWESPERERTLSQFVFHLFDRPERALNAYDVGEYTQEDRGRLVEDVLGPIGFQETARYGEQILDKVRNSLSSSSDFDQSKILRTYMGEKTTGEMLDLALGHSGHHLKQLYEYMALIGIKPDSPLQQQDFDGISVPTELF